MSDNQTFEFTGGPENAEKFIAWLKEYGLDGHYNQETDDVMVVYSENSYRNILFRPGDSATIDQQQQSPQDGPG
jgi:hypothetical protein